MSAAAGGQYLLQVPVVGAVRVETTTVNSVRLKLFAILRAADSKQPAQLLLIVFLILLYNCKEKDKLSLSWN